jgi:hypothetical protein
VCEVFSFPKGVLNFRKYLEADEVRPDLRKRNNVWTKFTITSLTTCKYTFTFKLHCNFLSRVVLKYERHFFSSNYLYVTEETSMTEILYQNFIIYQKRFHIKSFQYTRRTPTTPNHSFLLQFLKVLLSKTGSGTKLVGNNFTTSML